MIVNYGENKPMKVSSGTFNGLNIQLMLTAAVVNNALVPTDVLDQNISIQVVLRRGNSAIQVFSDSLQLLARHNSIRNQFQYYYNGMDMTYAGVAAKNVKMRFVRLMFGSPINLVAGRDELEIQISFNQGSLSANVDTSSVTFLNFTPNECVGYEIGVGQTRFETVQAAISNQSFQFADHTIFAQFINLDKNTMESPVISQLSLRSDRLNYSALGYEAYANNQMDYADKPAIRFGTALPISLASPTVVQGLDFFPQSLKIFGDMPDYYSPLVPKLINKGACNIIFNSANVAASQNFVGHTALLVDPTTISRTAEIMGKHAVENIRSLTNLQ